MLFSWLAQKFYNKELSDNSEDFVTLLKNNSHYFNENITIDQVLKLAFNSIKKVFNRKINIDRIEVGIIDKNKEFYKLNRLQIKKMI